MTESEVIEQLKKYKNRSELRKNDEATAYHAKRYFNDLLDKYLPIELIKKQDVLNEIKKHKTRGSFRKANLRLYNWGYKNLNKLDSFFPKHTIKWTLNSAKKELKKYKRRVDLFKKNLSLYYFMMRNHRDFLDKKLQYHFIFRTKESATKEALLCRNRRELKQNRGLFAYLRRNKMLPEINKLVPPANPDFKTSSEKFKELKRVIRISTYVDDVYRKGSKLYNFINHHKLVSMVKEKLIDRGHPLGWSKENVVREFNRYGKNLRKLKKERYSVYERGLLLDVFKGKNKKGRQVYSQSNINKIAKKCKSRQEFMVRHKSAYNSVMKFNLKLNLPDIPHIFKGEALLKRFIESVFHEKFVRIRPSFLKNPETGRHLELDLFSKNLNLAFEHNGQQHYQKKENHFFKKVKNFHKFKTERCQGQGITLIMVPDIIWIFKMDEKKIKAHLEKELLKNGFKLPAKFHSTKIF